MIRRLLLVFLIVSSQFLAAQPRHAWVKNYPRAGYFTGEQVVVAPNGDIIATGTFSGTVDFDPGPGIDTITALLYGPNIYIMRYDSAGNYLWVKRVYSYYGGIVRSVAFDPQGNIVLTGGFGGINSDFDPGPGVCNFTYASLFDIFILKLDGNGNFIWAKHIGGLNTKDELGEGIAIDKTGNIYITGTFGHFYMGMDFDPGPGTFSLSADQQDVYVLKLDANGNFIWAKSFRGEGAYDSGTAIGLGSNNDVYVTGYFTGKTDFDPGPGTYTIDTQLHRDAFVVRLDTSGGLVWARHLDSDFWAMGYSLITDASGNIYTAGHFWGNADFDPGASTHTLNAQGHDIYIWKLDPSGNLVWAKAMGGVNYQGETETAYALAKDQGGNIYVTGSFITATDFDPGPGVCNLQPMGNLHNTFVMKLRGNGSFVWATSIPGSGSHGRSIAVDNAGSIYTTGGFAGAGDFEPGTGVRVVLTHSAEDAYLWKLTQCSDTRLIAVTGPLTPLCAGQTTTITATGGSNYLWSTGTPGPSLVLSPALSVTLTVSAENAEGCIEAHDFAVEVTTCTSLEERSAQGLKFYPNPCSGVLQVSGIQSGGCTISTLTGAVILHSEVAGTSSIDISSLLPGVYIITIDSRPELGAKMLVKE